MITRRSKWLAGVVFAVVLAGSLAAQPPAAPPAQPPATPPAQDELHLDQIPAEVMKGLTARFPKAEIRKWSREEEDGAVLYDIEFAQESRKFEADIQENGTIHNWEKEIAAQDLPDAVREAVAKKHAKSVFLECMEITAVEDGKDVLEGYEVVLETVDAKTIEVTVTLDGEIVEDAEADEADKADEAPEGSDAGK